MLSDIGILVKPDATAEEVEKVTSGEGGPIFAQQVMNGTLKVAWCSSDDLDSTFCAASRCSTCLAASTRSSRGYPTNRKIYP